MRALVRVGLIGLVALIGRTALASEPLVIQHDDALLRLLVAHPQQRFAAAAEIITDPNSSLTDEIRARTSEAPMKHLFRASKESQAALEFVLLKREGGRVAARTRSADSSPNVVLLAADGLGAEMLAVNRDGFEGSPRIDRIAREGVVFEKASAPSAFSLPAYASLFSGVAPERHGLPSAARRGKDRIDRELPALAALLGDIGLDTAGFFTHPSLDGAWGFARGFDLYQGRLRAGAVALVAHARLWLDWHAFHAARGLESEAFFLFLQLADLRDPAQIPEAYRALFPNDAAAAALRLVDDQIGVLADALAGFGVLDDTVFVVVGAPTGATEPGDGAGRSPVALVMRYPKRIPAGRRIAAPVGTEQLLPVLVSWAGGSAPQPKPAWLTELD